MRSDPEITRAAIDATTDGNQSAFARLLGHSDASQIRAWLDGRVALTTAMRLLLRVIAAHPTTMVKWLTAANS